MGGRVSLNYIRPDSTNNGNKNLLIGLSNGEVIRVPMFEQINRIPVSEYNNKLEYEINYCVASPFNSLSECALLFNNNINSNYTRELDNYIVTNEGGDCNSLTFRPGSILYGNSEWLDGRTFAGKKCKIIQSGPSIYERDLQECCTGLRTNNCNANLINNFKTSHCNVTMQNFCINNPSNIYCYRWLESQTNDKNDIALKLYSDLCSNDITNEYCDYMCLFARNNGYYGYCDKSLIEWCNKNVNDNRCHCYNPPSDIIPDMEEVLGPKECWLLPCTIAYPGQKWLTTDQMKIRGSCAIQSCIISIDSLIANGNNKIDIINNCSQNLNISTLAATNVNKNTINNLKPQQTWGVFFDPILMLIFITLFIILLLYIIDIKPIYTIKINENRL